MRTLHMNEVIQHIDLSVQKKEKQREQLHQLWTSINNVIGVESFKGETAGAVKDNLVQAQTPVVLMLYYAYDQWITKLNNFKQDLLNFEEENSIYHEQFVTEEVKSSLDRLEQLTLDITGQINTHYGAVSHLAAASRVNDFSFIQNKVLLINHITRTNEDFDRIDSTNKTSLTSMANEISKLKSLLGEIKSWQSQGKSFDAHALSKIDDFVAETDVLFNMTAKGMELAIKNGDESLPSQIAGILDTIGKGQGVRDVARGVATVGLLLTNMVQITPRGHQFVVTVSEAWKKGFDGKYTSVLAAGAKRVFDVTQKPFSYATGYIRNAFSNTPANILKRVLGMKNNTNVMNISTLLDRNHGIVKFTTQTVGNTVKSTFNATDTMAQFTTKKGLLGVARRIPYVGLLVSGGINSGEFFNDANANKSSFEKTGRFAAGMGADIGIAGLTTGGAVIGTMICPGVGTIIGGAIGAGIGIVGSIALEDEIKNIGEKAGRQAEKAVESLRETADKATEAISDTTDKAVNFVKGWFK